MDLNSKFKLNMKPTTIAFTLAFAVVTWNHPILADSAPPDGWRGVSAREEIRPEFSYDPAGGPTKRGSLVIHADNREGLDGHWERTVPVTGGRHYQFRALRRVTNVDSPRRSTLVRILWRDAQGKP